MQSNPHCQSYLDGLTVPRLKFLLESGHRSGEILQETSLDSEEGDKEAVGGSLLGEGRRDADAHYEQHQLVYSRRGVV